jgi:hypothetical protein
MEASAQHTIGSDAGIPIGQPGLSDVDTIGWDFRRIYPLDDAPCFADLLRSIDEAETITRRSARPEPADR